MKGWHELSVTEKTRLVRKVYGDDGGSASGLAAKISQETGYKVTRNAIIGFYMRNPELKTMFPFTGMRASRTLKRAIDRLEPSPTQRAAPVLRQARKPRTAPAEKIEQEAPPPQPAPEPDEKQIYDAGALRVPLIELRACQCRFVVSESPYLFCGHKTTGPGSSWCEHHRQRVFLKSESL